VRWGRRPMKYLRQAAVACGLVKAFGASALAQSLHLDADGFVDLRMVQTPGAINCQTTLNLRVLS
jgi:hypothetical protein